MVYLNIVMAYLITIKPTLLLLFVSSFFYFSLIISVNIIVILLVWLSLLSYFLSSSVCLTISFRLLSQLYRKANLYTTAFHVQLVFFCSSISIVACVYKRPLFSIHSSSCHHYTAVLFSNKSIF